MRVLLRLLGLALVLIFPGSALCDSVDYQAAGTLTASTAFVKGMIAAGSTWEVGARLLEIDDLTTKHITTGNLGTVDVTSGTLFACSSGLCFKGGSLDIDRSNGTDYFLGTLTAGTISRSQGMTILTGFLANGNVAVLRDRGGNSFSSQALLSTPKGIVPEPNTLSLMGGGLVGFALLWRKKPCSGK